MAFEPRFTFTKKINDALLEIERARGFLDGIDLGGAAATRMREEAMALEAHHSTHIEGTRLTLSDARRILAGQEVGHADPDDRRELLNYREAMEFVSEYLDKKSEITEGLIKNIHFILVKNVRGDSLEPGKYRKVQNYVVNNNTGQVIYQPPVPEKVPGRMKDFVRWLNSDESHPVLVAGIAQHQFVDIHPFIDGNGRTARVLCTLILYQRGYDFKRLFSLSEFYDRDRQGYYGAIQAVREGNMDLTPWLEYFLGGLKVQMQDARERGGKIAMRSVLLDRAKAVGLNQRQRDILLYILEKGRAGVKDIERRFKVTRRTAQRDFSLLSDAGLVREVSRSRTDPTRYYELL